MSKIISTVTEECEEELIQVFEETKEKCGEEFEEQCKIAWEADQKQNKDGLNRNRWSAISLRLALAVFCRSKVAYEALKRFPMIQLPSVRQLQRIVSESAYATKQGECLSYLMEQAELYKSEQENKSKPGKAVGVLIFDECKLVGKMAWNSKSHEIYGISVSPDQFRDLTDVFMEFSDTAGSKAGEYVLQFVWRDLTSNCDILGPFWYFPKSLTAAQLWPCVNEVIREFGSCGFSVISLVCDGAASNLSLLKQVLCRSQGPFSIGKLNPDPNDEFSVPASFQNPYDPRLKIFVVICPSHMMKNIINLLFSSQSGGTKNLKLRPDSEYFGWTELVDLYSREVARRKTRSQRVPKLLKSHIDRDAWVKLSVFPAKIIQSERVIRDHLIQNQ